MLVKFLDDFHAVFFFEFTYLVFKFYVLY